ncbi:Vacuolar protein-sorting-associated protein 28 [Malassezia equina]|uniref:Vacuolar protein sorting-associated protein 28 n=1 Tax=Malassezia equina TaxID=1381935 RepID=A0AAF0EC23_9BASI|nr:Vacuolar protein-sorting-associated protein 28 [Malassezia equina]
MGMNVFEEQKLYHTSQEREDYDNMATLFSLITTLEFLERAYVRGAVLEEAYTEQCTRLLAQSKTVIPLLAQSTSTVPHFSSVEAFMRHYHMDHPAAAHRLALGVPATVEHAPIEAKALSTPVSVVGAQRVAETTQNFITLMDALKLQMRAKDQLHPLLSDVLRTYAPSPSRNEHAEEDVRAKLLEWLILLNRLSASEELDDAQSREMLFDVERAYTSWFQSLSSHGP